MKRRSFLFIALSIFALTGCNLLPNPSRRSRSSSNTSEVSEKHVHSWTTWEITKQSTCYEEGEMVRFCTVCGEEEHSSLGMTAHTFGEWVTVVAPTCLQSGIVRRECIFCGFIEEDYISPLEHDFVEIDNASKDYSPQEYFMRCNVCDSYAIRWDAEQYSVEDTSGSVTRITDSALPGIRFGTVQYSNGNTDNPGTHIVYNIYSPVEKDNLSLSFLIRTHASAQGYPIFDNYDGDSNFGYEYNNQGSLERSLKRYGLKVNDKQIPLGADSTEGVSPNTIAWFNWPVNFKLEAGKNRIELYCLGGYRPTINQFQITGFDSELVSGASQNLDAFSVEVTNKSTFASDFYVNSALDIDVNLTPVANVLNEYYSGNLVITSSNPSVVRVSGLALIGFQSGVSTITVAYRNSRDTFVATVYPESAIRKYGVAHEGTLIDPLSNEDAITITKSSNYSGESYYVKGVVDYFYYAPGTRTDGMIAFFLKPAIEGGEKFEIYKCYKEDRTPFTEDDIWVGGEVTVFGSFTMYKTQPETSSATFISCTGEKPGERQVLDKTFAEVLAIGTALNDGEEYYDYVKFQGYATLKQGNSYYLTATKGEDLISGISDANHGERQIYTNAIQLYNVNVGEIAQLILRNAKLEVKMIVKNYHGTIENGRTLQVEDVTLIEAGESWEPVEPEVQELSIGDFMALDYSLSRAYLVTGNIKEFDNGENKTIYGTMTITDGEYDLRITYSTANPSGLAWDGTNYSYTYPNDFLTNSLTIGLHVSGAVTLKLVRNDFSGEIRAMGVIIF